MAGDEEMKDAAAPAPAAPAPEPVKKLTPQQSLKAITALVEQAVKLKETRIMSGRLMRLTSSVRKQLTGEVLRQHISSSLPEELESKAFLLTQVQAVRRVLMGGTWQGFFMARCLEAWRALRAPPLHSCTTPPRPELERET